MSSLSRFCRPQFSQRLSVISQHVKMSTEAGEDVTFETDGKVGIITLNRPKALNAINLFMVRRITRHLKKCEQTKHKLVIIKGAGDKAFCAGGDIRDITDKWKVGDYEAEDFFREEYILNNMIGTTNLSWVALLDGVTMGGGVGLSVHGRFRVATERTVFAMPETAIGLFPDVGGGHFLPRMNGYLGRYLALSGERLKGMDVFKAGIATHYIPSHKLAAVQSDLVSLQNMRPHTISEVLTEYQEVTFDDFVLGPHMNEINRIFSADTVEEIMTRLEQEKSNWSQHTLKRLQRMSPTSMKVTLKQIQEGENMSLQDVLQMEYRIAVRCMQNHDFFEGVRSVLIDKDQKAQWKPSELQEVTTNDVAKYFAPLPDFKELVGLRTHVSRDAKKALT